VESTAESADAGEGANANRDGQNYEGELKRG